MTQPSPPARPRPLPWLDVMRAAAALLVLLSHVRAFTLRDAAAQPPLSTTSRALFAVTGLGHQAVIVFFVLSGFLVTRSMRRLADEGRWSLARFGIERLSRLWLVLVPCLLLGGVLDGIGLDIAASRGGIAHYGDLAVTEPGGAPVREGATFIGNLLFLQTIAVPVFGTNGPLWSLADEAWFYALAAFAFASWRMRARWDRAALPALALVVTIVWLPSGVLALFPVWLCGAACAVAREGSPVGLIRRRAAAPALVSFAAVLVASRLHLGLAPLAQDWLLGLATAWLLTVSTRIPDPARWWFRPVHGLSSLSYSLYLSHVPLLALCTTLLTGPSRLVLGAAGFGLMLLEAGLAIACAAGLWWAFERHTAALRGWILGRLTRDPATVISLAGRSAAR